MKLHFLCFSVALLATVIIWLYDFNTQGILNLTPAERELTHKALLSPTATSINDDTTENDEGNGRSKYLTRNDENDEGNSSDTEPLLR